jgi:tripartite-type tricarboxylate transporter receptor subunit TctC
MATLEKRKHDAMRNISRAGALAALWLAAAVAQVPATDPSVWPGRPLRIIVPEAAGGNADFAARAIAEKLAAVLGQPVNVEDRGSAGLEAAARSAPDGYTWLFAPPAPLVVDQYISKILPYSPEDDFIGVALIGTVPFALAASPDLQLNSLADLIASAKAQPGKLALASPGPRTLPGMLGGLLCLRAGIDLASVPYKADAGAGLLALQGIPGIAAAAQSGKLRALAVSSRKRLPELPDVPAFSETLPGFDYGGWFALVAPAGAPADAVARMNQELNRILLDPDFAQKLELLGVYTDGSGAPGEVDAFLRSERERWSQAVRELGIRPE